MLDFRQSLHEQLLVTVTTRRLFVVMATSPLIMSKIVGAQTAVRRLTLDALEAAMNAANSHATEMLSLGMIQAQAL